MEGGFTCLCYMQISSVENPPNNSNTGIGWTWKDETFGDPHPYKVNGSGAFWEDENGLPQPFPTPFEELNSSPSDGSSAGQHELILKYLGSSPPPSNFTLNTITKCYQVDDNTGRPITDPVVYTASYVWSEGENTSSPSARRFYTPDYQCFDVPAPPQPTPGGSDQ